MIEADKHVETATSAEWALKICVREGVEIVDPDGWDTANFQYSWFEELITEEEFSRRLCLSTLKNIKPSDWLNKKFPGGTPRGATKKWKQEDRQSLMELSLKESGRILMTAYYLLDLKDGMSCQMINDSTNEAFLISFKKIERPVDPA